MSQENIKKCRINNNKQILNFIKKELTPFKKGTNEEGPRLSTSDLKQLEIKHYTKKDWIELTNEVFNVVFKESPLKRTKYQGLKRNIKYASQRI